MLRRIYKEPYTKAEKRLASMLVDLTRRVKDNSNSWRHTDHAGVVGAQLCWMKRIQTKACNDKSMNRYEETTGSWEEELKQLSDAGIDRFWL